jgi:hypothetical protein
LVRATSLGPCIRDDDPELDCARPYTRDGAAETEGTEPLNFDWFFKQAGVDDEIEMLQMDVRNVDRHVPFIVECYRRWLIDREGEEGVDAFIERYVDAER